LLHATVSTGDPEFEDIALTPGADVTASMQIIFPANANPGTFVVDTCCIRPANHLVYVMETQEALFPLFESGTITLLPSAVKELETDIIPEKYDLEQNYPNPFNAGTVIRFAQPVDGNVNITVFNILGAKVRTLVDEFRVAGLHQTDWDGRTDSGEHVATGVYFYKIVTEGFVSTRKMLLLK
jgi:hypothetical protein